METQLRSTTPLTQQDIRLKGVVIMQDQRIDLVEDLMGHVQSAIGNLFQYRTKGYESEIARVNNLIGARSCQSHDRDTALDLFT